jgi:type II secretory pathway predicted ATPase ExeA
VSSRELLLFGDIWTSFLVCAKVDDVSQTARFIQYPSQHEAFHFLDDVLADPGGAGLLHGPAVAGKSDLINQIAVKVGERSAVAVIDGAKMKPTRFLTTVLTEFGYRLELSSVEELLSMVSVFSVQQTRSREAPVVIVENFNRMYPSTLYLLCKLATLRAGEQFALRIVLISDKGYEQIISAPGMSAIADRLCGTFELRPLTARESLVYLYARLESLGIENPDAVFTSDVRRALREATRGWPGKLDAVAEAVAARAAQLPIDLDVALADLQIGAYAEDAVPELIVSYSGVVTARIKLVRDRYILGRSELSDIVIDNRFVSKHHALLVKSDHGLLLADMKSRNGTFVNSRRIESRVLRNNDVIALGDYRIKVIAPAVVTATDLPQRALAETAKMKRIGEAQEGAAEPVAVPLGEERREA